MAGFTTLIPRRNRMKKTLLTFLFLLASALPATATLITYDFIFSGAAYDGSGAEARGSITFESDYITNPGRNIFDLTTLIGLTAVPNLTVTVDGSSFGPVNGTFTRPNFSLVIFDTSLTGLDLARQLVGQTTASPNGMTWGQIDPIPDSNPPQSYTGDFQLFAVAGSSAPSGIYPFQLGTGNGTIDGLQLTSMTPRAPAPEPATWLLISLGLGGLALLRRRRKG